LLELIDTEYDRLLTEREDYRSKIQVGGGDRRLNSDVLEAILDDRLPRKNKNGYEPYSMLVWELSKLGITRAKEIEELISRRLGEAIEEYQKIVGGRQKKSGDANDDETDVFFTHTGLLNIMLEKEYGLGFHSKIFEKVEDELSPDEEPTGA